MYITVNTVFDTKTGNMYNIILQLLFKKNPTFCNKSKINKSHEANVFVFHEKHTANDIVLTYLSL